MRHFSGWYTRLCYYDGWEWTTWLSLVEFAYNASQVLNIEHNSFQANFGFILGPNVACGHNCQDAMNESL
jgi:hypothetical protein